MKRFILSSFVMFALAVSGIAHAISWTSEELFRMAKNGEISSGMWSRGELDKRKGSCGWSNADATYRVTNLGMKLENLAQAANQSLDDAEIRHRAEVLAKEVNKSTMYQSCFRNMLNVDFKRPKSFLEHPEHPYGQKVQ